MTNIQNITGLDSENDILINLIQQVLRLLNMFLSTVLVLLDVAVLFSMLFLVIQHLFQSEEVLSCLLI